MSKHTPGPWFVSSYGSFKVASLTNVTGIYADQMPTEASIVADATLIAAAPDMYEELRRALNVLDATGATEDANAARAALAKAEGKT